MSSCLCCSRGLISNVSVTLLTLDEEEDEEEDDDTAEDSSPEEPAADMLQFRSGSLCSVCSICEYCSNNCGECPCEEGDESHHCEHCQECSSCYICPILCDTICTPGLSPLCSEHPGDGARYRPLVAAPGTGAVRLSAPLEQHVDKSSV
ncbi:Sarcoplasmic reticulum histidine-rich calcium-binding protein [Liparis tanakae]|uniref:Sarcoplasmic reticulum histidine-rich calcium-binding protein n=1 Tax=Liparis tanakae TaxID=230148 RepID=A0A4Z2GM28_9TELE|nr:Sarcoplasmic reticulum histidine-rich calcium-binding protein [Liparis tanakae]